MPATLAKPSEGAVDRRRTVRFTPAEFWSLHEQGMLPERCELVDGEIIEMPAQYNPANLCIRRIDRTLTALWHDPDLITANTTHVFASGWNPMPDFALFDELIPRRPDPSVPGFAYPMPRLVVEVSDSTLDYDLGEKASRYAAEGVPELWVADVNGRRLHAFRDPDGPDWRLRRLFKPGDTVSPLCLPDAGLAVADLLPDLYGPA